MKNDGRKATGVVLVSMLVGALAGCGDDSSTASGTGGAGGQASGGMGGSAAGGGGMGGDAGDELDWSCLGQVEPPAFTAGSAEVTFTLQTFPGATPVPDAILRVCDAQDVACTNVLSEGTTDAAGQVVTDVPTDAPMLYEVTSPTTVPALFFRRGLPPTAPFEIELGALSLDTHAMFLGFVGAQSDPDRGDLVLTGRDCQAQLAEGVRFEVESADDETTLVYLTGPLPSASATATDASGRAGAIHLPPGPTTVRAYRADTDELIATRDDIEIRAGWATYAGLVPTP